LKGTASEDHSIGKFAVRGEILLEDPDGTRCRHHKYDQIARSGTEASIFALARGRHSPAAEAHGQSFWASKRAGSSSAAIFEPSSTTMISALSMLPMSARKIDGWCQRA